MADLPFELFQPRRVAPASAAPSAPDCAQEVTQPAAERIIEPEPAPPEPLPSAELEQESSDEIDLRDEVREIARRIAERACTRLLRRTLAADPSAIGRLVDEGIALAGADIRAVRLNPQDAAGLECAAMPLATDAALTRGAVEIESAAGTIATDIERRGALLAGWAADCE